MTGCCMQLFIPSGSSSGFGITFFQKSDMAGASDEDAAILYKWRKYLLLLAILVATVTYVAGLNPPGGVWLDAKDGHLTGDPILPLTYPRRYQAFFHCNAMAFMASLAVIILLLNRNIIGHDLGLAVLTGAMLLVLLGLLGAYAAGSCRDVVTSIYVSVLVVLVLVLAAVHLLACSLVDYLPDGSFWKFLEKLKPVAVKKDEHEHKERRKFLMLLAIFATSVTYVAGLSPPGGFWPDSQGGHLAGEPVLFDRHVRRFRAFFVCNATAFVASLVMVILLLVGGRAPKALAAPVTVQLFGLMGAYAAGSSRAIHTTVYVICLIGAVLAYLVVGGAVEIWPERGTKEASDGGADRQQSQSETTDGPERVDALEDVRSLLLLLATLAATVAYQAGLNPPGGVWPDNRDGHRGGDPILLETHTRRYRAFFYCNATAFVASLVIIVMVQSKAFSSGKPSLRVALQAAMILDLFGLVGAYAIGSCRDVATSFYVSALAVAVSVYAVIHVAVSTTPPDNHWKWLRSVQDRARRLFAKPHTTNEGDSSTAGEDDVKKKRNFLLMLAILAATVTYQAGLTPPGGFWTDNDESHRAGDPILQDHYPRRYKVFFYCNATGFMASVAIIMLIINTRLSKKGIRCYALRVCMGVGLLGLMGAYAAGSCRRVRTSIYVFALVVAVLAFVTVQIALFVAVKCNWRSKNPADARQGGQSKTMSKAEQERKRKRKYLVLLGILAASVTYQAGLSPPGGVWLDSNDGHLAGNPVLRDSDKARYRAFFYCNATSFMASIVVVILLLLRTVKSYKEPVRAMQTVVVLDMAGLLGAYAAGSSREWEESAYVIALVIPVLVCIAVHTWLSPDKVVLTCCGESLDRTGGSSHPGRNGVAASA